MKKFLFLLLFLHFVIFLFSCNSKKSSNNEIVVAKVGDENISLKELETSLNLNPQYSIRTTVYNARKSQLKYLIDNEYYFIAAEKTNIAKHPIVQKRLKYIKNQEIVRAYINQEFVENIKISQSEISSGLRNMNKQINVTNFFFTNPDSAKICLSKLNSDINFGSKGTDLGWVKFGDLENEIEKKLFSLNKGEISNVIKSKYGYHVFIVNNIRTNPDVQNAPVQTLRSNVIEIIKKRKVNKKIENKLDRIVGESKIKINNKIINILSKYIDSVLNHRQNNPTILMPPIQNMELNRIETNVKYILDEEIALFGKKKWTTGFLLERLKEMPPFHRPYLATRSRVIQSILDLFKNDILLSEALSKGYDKNNEFISNYNKYKKDLLVDEFKSKLSSKDFQISSPQKYDLYKEMLQNVKHNIQTSVNEEKLFLNIDNPKNVYVDSPIPVTLKNKYEW